MNLLWNTNIYSDVGSLAVSGSDDRCRVFAGNLVTSTIIVGDLRPKRKPEDSLEVATMITGKAPVCVSDICEVFVCGCHSDYSVLVYKHTKTEWSLAAKLDKHTDQVN